jgi:hypothetical protein
VGSGQVSPASRSPPIRPTRLLAARDAAGNASSCSFGVRVK